MASLKEVKDRIISVGNIRKITSAMKMIASAKLHKAQQEVENMLPYERQLSKILADFLRSGVDEVNIYTSEKRVKHTAIVVFSSNTSLCGVFNANIIRNLVILLDEYKSLGLENVSVYPVGKKVAEAAKRLGVRIEGNFETLAEKPSYDEAVSFAKTLMLKFENGEIDKVELLYNHYRSTAVQEITKETYLPFQFPKLTNEDKGYMNDYIMEPSVSELIDELVPKVLLMKMYTVCLDSNASEHAARLMAMQMAMDNSNNLLHDLNIAYNKSRQQAINNELLDIMGGSLA